MDEIPVLQLMGWPAHDLRTSLAGVLYLSGCLVFRFSVRSVCGDCVCGRPEASHSELICYSYQLERGPCRRPLWNASIHDLYLDMRLSWDEGLSSLSFAWGMADKLLLGDRLLHWSFQSLKLNSSPAPATGPGCEQVMTEPQNLCVQSLGGTELVAFIFYCDWP